MCLCKIFPCCHEHLKCRHWAGEDRCLFARHGLLHTMWNLTIPILLHESWNQEPNTYRQNSLEVLKDSPFPITKTMMGKVRIERVGEERVNGLKKLLCKYKLYSYWLTTHRTHDPQPLNHVIDRIPSCLYITKQLQWWDLYNQISDNKIVISIAVKNNSTELFPTLARCANGTNNNSCQSNWVSSDSLFKGLFSRTAMGLHNSEVGSFFYKCDVRKFGNYMLTAYVDDMRKAPTTCSVRAHDMKK